MKYSVTLQCTHDFKIDTKGLIKWAKDTLSLEVEQYNENWMAFYKEGELTPTEDSEFKSDEHKQLKEYYDSLVKEDEEAKLTLPSRLEGQAAVQWEAAKKAEIAQITDFSTLSEAQKKLWMGLGLTDEEKDALGA